MPSITVNGLNIDQSEVLLLAWSPTEGQWVASVGDIEVEDQRELEYATTAEEALGMLLLRLGTGKIEDAS
jgi:hypothetical protein